MRGGFFVKQVEVRQAWESRVVAYKASGQSATEWCAAHQLTTHQLWYWLRKFSNKKPAAAFGRRFCDTCLGGSNGAGNWLGWLRSY
jgi:hypothetical protein